MNYGKCWTAMSKGGLTMAVVAMASAITQNRPVIIT
jgi:hypothetical protein